MTETMINTLTSPDTREGASPGQRFLDALTRRDFAGLQELLTPDVWLRALLPRHLDEHYGAAETTAAFESWYGLAQPLEALAWGHDTVAGKERISYRFQLRPEWAPATWHVIEQMAFLSVKDGQIRKVDLVCTGFFPVDDPSVA